MGLFNIPDIFQVKMNEIFIDLEYVKEYLDGLLVLIFGELDYHLDKLETLLKKLLKSGFIINVYRSFFDKIELEYY